MVTVNRLHNTFGLQYGRGGSRWSLYRYLQDYEESIPEIHPRLSRTPERDRVARCRARALREADTAHLIVERAYWL